MPSARARARSCPARAAQPSGLLLARAGAVPASLEAFMAATRLDPNNARAWNNQANALRVPRPSARAAEAYRTAARLAPRDPDPRNGLGVLAVEPATSRRRRPLPRGSRRRPRASRGALEPRRRRGARRQSGRSHVPSCGPPAARAGIRPLRPAGGLPPRDLRTPCADCARFCVRRRSTTMVGIRRSATSELVGLSDSESDLS